MTTKHIVFPDGLAIQGAFPEADVMDLVKRGMMALSGQSKTPLIIADCPYGNIPGEMEKKYWDRVGPSDIEYAKVMIAWTQQCETVALPNSALYVFGGVGTPQFRPFYRYLLEAEHSTNYRLSSQITWKKKRAYGINWGYLFTREEIAYFVLGNDIKKPRLFNIALLSTKRGYMGYDKDHPAKSEYFRRTNVWTDIDDAEFADVWEITEIMRGKTHINQKPQRIMEIPIEVHTVEGECVFDPFAGSGTTAHAARKLKRKFVVIERDPIEFEKMVASLK